MLKKPSVPFDNSLLGRFATPDTIVQFAHHSQSYNRYSYVHNNPLSFTDPTGQGLFKSIRRVFKSVSRTVNRVADWGGRVVHKAMENPYVRTAVAMWAGYQMGLQARFAYYDSTLTGAGLTEAQIAAIGTTGNIIGGTAGGFASGAVAGGNLRSGFQGSLSGGLFGGVNSYTQYWSVPGQIGAKAFTGGVLADLQGGDFRTGFIYSGSSATAAWGYQKFVGYMANPSSGDSIAPRGPREPPPPLVNTIGTQVEALKPGIGDYLFSAKEGSFLSQALNLVPGVNAVSSFHDNIVIKFDQDTFMRDWVMNAPTMPIAAMITYGALLDGPLATHFGVDRSR